MYNKIILLIIYLLIYSLGCGSDAHQSHKKTAEETTKKGPPITTPDELVKALEGTFWTDISNGYTSNGDVAALTFFKETPVLGFNTTVQIKQTPALREKLRLDFVGLQKIRQVREDLQNAITAKSFQEFYSIVESLGDDAFSLLLKTNYEEYTSLRANGKIDTLAHYWHDVWHKSSAPQKEAFLNTLKQHLEDPFYTNRWLHKISENNFLEFNKYLEIKTNFKKNLKLIDHHTYVFENNDVLFMGDKTSMKLAITLNNDKTLVDKIAIVLTLPDGKGKISLNFRKF